ncbi:tetratricopeptide repeat protein [Myxococcaceae bacterium JPH2]|nr:tetratricopeptide repeat protein [Myxococcaceae bacterium JPH2]
MASMHAREGGRLLQMGVPQEAVKAFQKGLSIDPHDVDCLLGLVRTHLSTGAAAEAEAAVLRLLKVKPDHVEGQGHLAMLRAQAGNAEALEALKVLAAAPDAGYFERFNLGSLLFERGDLAGARAAFASALEVVPGSAHTHFELGRIGMQSGDLSSAVTHFQKASELAPQEAMPLLMLSRAHAARGDVGLALQTATQVLDKAQGATQRAALEDLFKLYLAAGSPDGAKRAVQELRRLEPTNVNYVYLHGVAMMSAGQGAEAKALFAEALQGAPSSWQVRHALAQVCTALGERDMARSLLQEVVSVVPRELGPANDLAALLMAENAHALALPVLERALAAHPRDAGTHLNLARATQSVDAVTAAHHARQAQALGDSDIQAQATQLLEQLGA